MEYIAISTEHFDKDLRSKNVLCLKTNLVKGVGWNKIVPIPIYWFKSKAQFYRAHNTVT